MIFEKSFYRRYVTIYSDVINVINTYKMMNITMFNYLWGIWKRSKNNKEKLYLTIFNSFSSFLESSTLISIFFNRSFSLNNLKFSSVNNLNRIRIRILDKYNILKDEITLDFHIIYRKFRNLYW